MKTISRYIMTLALLITAVGGAWAQAPTIYCQQDYSDGVADWTSGNTGRYTVDMNEGKYLTVNAVGNGNNGTTITGTTVNQVIPAGEDFEKSGDFTMSFDLQLTDGNNRSSWFHINDASNDNGDNETVGTHMLTLQAAAANSTKWKINGSETQTLDLAKATWYSFKLTKKGAKLYLTVVPTAGGDALMNDQLITVNSTVGGLGNMIFETNRYYAFMAIDNVLVSEVVDDAPASEPAIDVTTNAASEQDLFTEASFKMPTFDATVNYMLVRDMQDEANPVAFSGLPSSGNIVVKKGDDGKYQPAEALTIQLIDPLAAADAQNIIAADGITIKVLVGDDSSLPIEYDYVSPITLEAFLADMKPGYYWIKAEPTDENSPYDGTVYSSEFTVVEKYDLTVKPANDFSKGKIDAVTVGSQSVTIDANTGEATKTGITPDTEVKLKAKRGYVIDKVEVKKGIVKLLTLNVGGDCPGTITYAEGETWGQAIQNHPTENTGWTIGSSGSILYNYYGVWLGNDRVKKEDAITPGLGYYTE